MASDGQVPEDELQAGELQQFEALLRNCAPAAMQIDRDRLMYSAGLASAGEKVNLQSQPLPTATGVASSNHRVASYKSFAWPLATAALLLLSLTLGAAILFRSTEVRVVYVPQPAAGGSAEFASLPTTKNLQPAANDSDHESTKARKSPPTIENPHFAAARETSSYLHLRNLVLERGVEALPDTAVAVSNKPKQPDQTIFVSPLLRHEF